MPANGQAKAASQISNLFGNGFDQKLNALNKPAAGVRSSTWDDNSPLPTQGPANASAAPVAGTHNVFTGLTAALNNYQQILVKKEKREIPDRYVIEFAPPSMGAATIKRPGPQDATTAPMQTPNSAAKIAPETNALDRNAQTWPVSAGTQIVKVIDDVMRNSSFITDQQNVEVTTSTDPVTGLQTQKLNAKAGTGDMQWYKISVSATQIGYDNIIRDHAFLMKFIVTPYAVAQMTSQYFPNSKYKGVHKAYQYWFTGANTQILNYEQSYNNAYRILFSGIGEAAKQKGVTTDFRDQNRYIYMATSSNQATGAKNYANDPGNSGASFLYDPSSFGSVKMRIVGDPAWMQQGEAGLGVSAATFDFSPFNTDGGINYDSRAVMFSVAFNTPADYDFNTGLVNVNANNRGGQPQEYYTFQAVKCKSIFSKGKFEQEIEGKLIIEQKKQEPANGRSATPNSVETAPGSRDRTTAQDEAQDLENGANAGTGTGSTLPDDGSHGYAIQDETGQVSNLRKNEYGDLYYPAEPQPATPPAAPTSSGDIKPATSSGDTTPTLPRGQAAAAEQLNNIFGNGLNQRLAAYRNKPQIIAKDDS